MTNWISVEKEFPTTHQRVLVVCVNKDDYGSPRHIGISTYLGKHNGKPWWSRHYLVSHWAPLPEMPEEKKSVFKPTLEDQRRILRLRGEIK